MSSAVRLWLESLLLERYYELLVSAGYNSLAKCNTLTDQELDTLGINPPGHRKRILAHLPDLDIQMSFDRRFDDLDSPVPPPPCWRPTNEPGMEYVNVPHYNQDDIYDSPRPTQDSDEEPTQEEVLYVNVDDLNDKKSKSHVQESGIPLLPPKLGVKKQHDIDAELGIVHTTPVSANKKPVPVPRGSLRKKPVPRPRLKKMTSPNGTFDRDGETQLNTSENKTDMEKLRNSNGHNPNSIVEEETQYTNDVTLHIEEESASSVTSGHQSNQHAMDNQVYEEIDCSDDTNVAIRAEEETDADVRGLAPVLLPIKLPNTGPVPHLPIKSGFRTSRDVDSGEDDYDIPSDIAPDPDMSYEPFESEYYNYDGDVSSSSKRGSETSASIRLQGVTVDESSTAEDIDEAEENARNEMLYQSAHLKPGPLTPASVEDESNYQGVWDMSTGSRRSTKTEENLESLDNDYFFPPPNHPPPNLPQNLEYVNAPAVPPRPCPARISSIASDGSFTGLAQDRAAFNFTPENVPKTCGAENDHCGARYSGGAFGGREDRSSGYSKKSLKYVDSLEYRQDSDTNVYAPDPAALRALQSTYVQKTAPPPPPRESKPPNFFFVQEPLHGEDYSFEDVSGSSPPASVSGGGWASCESDDTLSDGGDFLDDIDFHFPSLDVLRESIPIVQLPHNKVTERSGFLYKLTSRQGRKPGYQKKWVTFDSKKLKYYSSRKDGISRRIIPVLSMFDVKQEIKTGDSNHPFHFKVTTVDRMYSFATQDSDDLAFWTSMLMQSILETRSEENFQEGGDMANPDKQGLVKMDGLKGKRYMAIKKDKMCYYNTHNDYKVASPIHEIEMNLATVKEVGKNKLQLITPYVSYTLTYDSPDELLLWKESFQEAVAEGIGDDSILKQVHANHSNRLCADCGAPDPKWASVNFCVTLCKLCAGIHRSLTIPLSKIRSLRMDFRVWTETLLQLFRKVGNDNANNFWEWNSSEDDRIDSDADTPSRREYIMAKYQEKMFCKFHPIRGDQLALDEALCKAVQYDDVLETMQLLFSGADILCTTTTFTPGSFTPLQLAKRAKQVLQMEFLHQNGAEGSGQLPVATSLSPATSILPKTNDVLLKGYLHKTGSNQKGEFLRRWCILEHGILSYFENEKSILAKDSIERKEMVSVAYTTVDRMEYAFELGTTKQGGRVYLFAADSYDDRHRWMVNLAKNILVAYAASMTDRVTEFDRGGLVFARDGATSEWKQCWIHLKRKILYLLNKDKDTSEFEEVDLRKIKLIKRIQSRETFCQQAREESNPFVIDLPNKGRALYIQADIKKETETWYSVISKATTVSGASLAEQQLTPDGVPIIVDKCIKFIELFGLQDEGIYRHSAQHSKVSKLLELFSADARSVQLRQEEFSVHEVANALKRQLRTLDDPLLTQTLYTNWINTANLADISQKMEWYKRLLKDLPTENYKTLKCLISHLSRVVEHEQDNLMGSINIASIFGPILMTTDRETQTGGFGNTNQEISVMRDLLDNHMVLFEVKAEELEHARQIEEAKKKILRLNSIKQVKEEEKKLQAKIERAIRKIAVAKVFSSMKEAPDLLMTIFVNNKEGPQVNTKIGRAMTAGDLLDFVKRKQPESEEMPSWGLFEVICQGDLERPIHFNEKVLDLTLKWGDWPDDVRTNSYLCVKPNYVYEEVEVVYDPTLSLYSELKFSDKKGFKKYCFEFSQSKLTYQKDTKATTSLGAWNVEDMRVFMGVQQKRAPPTKWGFTFVSIDEKYSGKESSTFFGHSVCCNNEEEFYRWIAAIMHAQHPEGLLQGTSAEGRPISRVTLNTSVPVNTTPGRPRKQPSIFHRLMHR